MSFSHLNAPATLLLATRCCCCHIPLVDSVSIETGIGPICRRKHGYNADVDEDARAEANKLVHQIATDRLGTEVEGATERLYELGFEVLASRITERLEKAARNADKISIEVNGATLTLATPYRRGRADEFKAAMQSIPGRHWDRTNEVNTFPTSSKRQVWGFLQEFFPGCYGRGPKGVFEIPKPVKQAKAA